MSTLKSLKTPDDLHEQRLAKLRANPKLAEHVLTILELIDSLTCLCGNKDCNNSSCLAVRALRQIGGDLLQGR